MKLEFLADLTAGGKYNPSIKKLVRLYDFGTEEARLFQQAIRNSIVECNGTLGLADLEFIELVNCNVTFRIAEEDTGLTTGDDVFFFCDLMLPTYKEMLDIIDVFCKERKSYGHNWLYDPWESGVKSHIEFLFSPGGTW
ncbi:MAG: hypothetical protein QM731_20700 [Chitinophagaceae bacterium]